MQTVRRARRGGVTSRRSEEVEIGESGCKEVRERSERSGGTRGHFAPGTGAWKGRRGRAALVPSESAEGCRADDFRERRDAAEVPDGTRDASTFLIPPPALSKHEAAKCVRVQLLVPHGFWLKASFRAEVRGCRPRFA